MTTYGRLYRIVAGTASLVGQDYFDALVRLVADTFQVTGAYLAEYIPEDPDRMRIVASTVDASTISAPDLSVLRTPNATISRRDMVRFPAGAAGAVADPGPIREAGSDAYLALPLVDTNGELLGELGVISERRVSDEAVGTVLRLVSARTVAELRRGRVETELRQRDRRLREFAGASADIFLQLAWLPEPRIEYVNPAWESVTGYQRGELYAHPELLLSIVAAEDRETVLRCWRSRERLAGTVRMLRKDGREIRVDGRATHIVNDAGVLVGIQAVLRDVTARERASRAVAQEAQRFRSASAALPEAVLMVADRKLLYVNPRAEALLVSPGADLLAARIEDPAEENLWITLGDWIASVAGLTCTRSTVRLRGPDNHVRWIQLSAVPLDLDECGATTLVVASDVTVAVERERELAKTASITRGVLSAALVPILILDRGGVVTAANEAWTQIGLRHQSVRPPDIDDNYIDACRRAAEEGVEGADSLGLGIDAVSHGRLSTFRGEYRGLWSNDETWYSVVASPYQGGIVVIHVDISELRRDTETLSEIESRERWLLEHLPDQVFKIAPDGTLLDAVHLHDATVALIPAQVAPGINVRDVLPEPAAAALVEAATAATASKKVSVCRLRLPFEDSEHIFETRVVPVSEVELVAIARDLSSELPVRVDVGAARTSRPRTATENRYGLTFREFAVLEAMSRGAADKEIANELSLSVFTVNKHVSNILRKMGALSRTEASTRTLREGLMN